MKKKMNFSNFAFCKQFLKFYVKYLKNDISKDTFTTPAGAARTRYLGKFFLFQISSLLSAAVLSKLISCIKLVTVANLKFGSFCCSHSYYMNSSNSS